MGNKLYLIKEGEISLKGGNRNLFEKQLRHNIKNKLRPYHSDITKQKGRLYAEISDEAPDELVEKALSTTSGITAFARAYMTEKNIESIVAKALEILPSSDFKNGESFRVTVKREDKTFPMNSHETSCALADAVFSLFPEMTVDLKHPEHTLTCEIRNDVYLYTSEKKGESGLPYATAGKGMLLLSGGIDSPVAGYMMAKRGMKLDAIYFHAYPYTSEMALEKVKKLASIIAPYLGGLRLFVVPFTEGQEYIRDHGYEEEATLMFRASMMRTAERIALENGGNAIVTGEALSQVASQTLDAMSFTDSMTEILVLRPLVGMDKEEITRTADRIGPYETWVLPYEDCCVVFSPKHPVTRPVKSIIRKHFEALAMDEMIDKAVKNTVVYSFDPMGNEING